MAVVAPISFAQRIRDLAGQDPDRPAVTCGDRSLTRAELDRAATSLGHDLRAGGVRVGDMVTVALPNSVDWFVAFAACWKIGAIPQPVSARLPVRELTAIVELSIASRDKKEPQAVRFEMDQQKVQTVLEQINAIQAQIAKISG